MLGSECVQKVFFKLFFLHLFCNFELEFELVLDMNQLNFNKIFEIRENKKNIEYGKNLLVQPNAYFLWGIQKSYQKIASSNFLLV